MIEGLFFLLLGFCCWVTTYVGLYTVITKAGYSGRWILLPLTVPAVLIISWAVEIGSLVTHDLSATISALGAAALIIWLTCLANWIAFLVFAFSEWPVLRDARRSSRTLTERALRTGMIVAPTVAATVPFGAPMPGAAVAPTAVAGPGVRAVVGTPFTPVRSPSAPSTFYCSWCGTERRSDAASIHHCGSRERPAVYCSGCGTVLDSDASFCGRCGTSTEHRSPG